MAGVLKTLVKSKKVSLPPGWEEAISIKHPDRTFYYNEETGMTSWLPPVELENKKHKTKKRKIGELDNDEFSDASPGISKKLLKDITSRQKLKPRMKNASSTSTEKPNNDTPAMRSIREKMAQKNIRTLSKRNIQKRAGTDAEQEKSINLSEPSISSHRSQRSSSNISSSTMTASECSNLSSTSSMGTKIIRATSASRAVSLNKESVNKRLERATKLPRIQKVDGTSEIKSKTILIDNSDKTVNHKNSDDGECTNNLRKTYRKNTANERMNKIRKVLNTQTKNPISNELTNKSKLNNSTSISSNVHDIRLFNLEKIDSSYYEEMEWEPIEDEKIMSEVYMARSKVCEKPVNTHNDILFNVLQIDNISQEKNAVYIVIDTNVFLSNLLFIEEVRDSNFEVFGRPFIVIPWTVLQELDFIKDDKNNTRSQALKYKARKAVEFLNQHFNAKHPRFLGQTLANVEENKNKFIIECPDDEILQTCLQIKESAKFPVLLSYDKNLCTKAIIHNVPVLGRNDPLEKIYHLKSPNSTQLLDNNSLHLHTKEKQEEKSVLQEELLLADDILEEGKAILKSVLSQVVAKEMETLFGTRWEKHVIIHPPWTVVTVLKCALKHWMAAVSESFERRTEPLLRDLQIYITEVPENGRKLKDVNNFLSKCMDVFQTLDSKKYPTFKTKVMSQIDDLLQKCMSLINEINSERLNESVGTVEKNEEEEKASLAFKIFEDIYDLARDICGIASNALSLQCAFDYNKFNPRLTPQLALQQQQEIGVNVNKILETLRIILSNNCDNMCPNDKEIISLYETLVHFLSNWKSDELLKLTPVDVYCCLKLKRSILERGYQQLQDLVVHFCRIANLQCK